MHTTQPHYQTPTSAEKPYQICSLILLPSSSIVLILKSIPERRNNYFTQKSCREAKSNGFPFNYAAQLHVLSASSPLIPRAGWSPGAAEPDEAAPHGPRTEPPAMPANPPLRSRGPSPRTGRAAAAAAPAGPPGGPVCSAARRGRGRCSPMVEMKVALKASSEKRNRAQVLPTPESPISSSLNR